MSQEEANYQVDDDVVGSDEVQSANLSDFLNKFRYDPLRTKNYCEENSVPTSSNTLLEELALKQSIKRQQKVFEVKTIETVSKQQRFKERIRNSLTQYAHDNVASSSSTSLEPNISFEYLQTNSFDERQQNDVVFDYDPVFDQPRESNTSDDAVLTAEAQQSAVSSHKYFEDNMFVEDESVLNELLMLE